MTQPGRNDLCPCGSGKKYKKCCLLNEAAAQTQREEQPVIPRMLDWLAKNHGKEIARAVYQDYFRSLDEDELDKLNELDAEMQRMLNINMGEWTLADGYINMKGKRIAIRKLLLGPGGPLLSASARESLQRLVERRMSIYEARSVNPGEGVEVADLLRPDEPSVWVVERSASQSLVRWDTFGARLMRQDDGWGFSGSIYPLLRDVAAQCREEIQQETEGADLDSELARKIISSTIIDCWVKDLVVERPLPQLVDTSTGEPITLVTEHYRVTDWNALIAALDAQPDVEGDRENGWVRFVDLQRDVRRSQASLNVKGRDSLEVFCRTVKLADEARPWLEGIAAKALVHKAREIVDPRSPKALASASKSGARRSEVPPEVEAQLVREMLTKHYESWPDMELPALGGKTPRQAVATPDGRQAVVELLKEIEQFEARKAADDGSEPFDFGFLWLRLGLDEERNR